MQVASFSLGRIDTPLEAVSTPVLDPGLAVALNDAPNGLLDIEVDGFVRHQGQEALTVSVRGRIDKPNAPFGGQAAIGTLSGSLGGLPLAVALNLSGLTLRTTGTLGENRVDLATSAHLFSRKYVTSGSVGEVQADFDLRRSGRSAQVSGRLGGEPLRASAQEAADAWILSGTVAGYLFQGTLRKVDAETYVLVEEAGPLRIEETIRIRPSG